MFRKLKIQLTLINLILLSIVLLIIFSGIYTLMKSSIDNQSKMRMSTVARSGRVFLPNRLRDLGPPEEKRVLSNCFYIKIDFSKAVTEISPNVALSSEDAKELIKASFTSSKKGGTISYKAVSLRYLIANKPYGHIIVFQEPEYDVLNWLVIISIVIGGISLLLVFGISLFLASRALVPIKSSWDKQRAFVADASHELRTPLSVISTNLEIVLDNGSESIESQSKWLENIQSEVKRMSRLVEELLFLARSDSNTESVQMSKFNLSNALMQLVELFTPFALEKGIVLSYRIDPNLIFLGNEGRMKQLITILLDNAIQYTNRGGKIELTAKTSETSIEISVQDNGAGIPSEHLDKIFERFYKVDKARTSDPSGSGLGLAIAKRIATDHKGLITVTSTVNQGSTFKLTFPKYTSN